MLLFDLARDVAKVGLPAPGAASGDNCADDGHSAEHSDSIRIAPAGKPSQQKEDRGDDRHRQPTDSQRDPQSQAAMALSHRLQMVLQMSLYHTVASTGLLARRETKPATHVSNINTTKAESINHLHSFWRASSSAFWSRFFCSSSRA